jgi:hypothetical protein
LTDIVPKTIAAGVNFSATAWRTEYSGAEWSMVLLLRGPASIDLSAGRDGARHVWDVPASESAAWAPGVYAYQVRATNDAGDAATVESGTRTIAADFAGLAPGSEVRSLNRIALDAIEAVLAKRATMDQDRYRINNRELYRTSPTELLKLRAFYQQKVDEESGGGRSRFRDLRVRMRPIGR